MRKSTSSKARKGFKPPARVGPGPTQPEVTTPAPDATSQKPSEQPEDLESLKAKEAQLDADIRKLEDKGLKAEQHKEYINGLHKYNEVKDVAQMFMGRLAVYECVTNKEIARRYDAPESD